MLVTLRVYRVRKRGMLVSWGDQVISYEYHKK